LLAALRSVFTVERLGDPSIQGPMAPPGEAGRRRPGLARTLFEIEPLPLDPPADPSSNPRLGLARALFGREPLPLDAVAARPRRTRWLRWLFGTEPLDPS
jgi:hypothetical protein